MSAQQANITGNNQVAASHRVTDTFSSSRSYAPEYQVQTVYTTQRRLCEHLREEARRERTKVSVVCKDLVRPQSTILAEKYLYLLQIIRDMRYDIRRSYAGSRTSMENLRKRVGKARTIVLECKDLCTRREYDHCQILMQYPSTTK
ncbi:unnamed protein product [Adineta ricciae]|uniref:Uncharacterized protein n=1 Tax=Adineta ricciae TaxID=249248 RepID=A0A814E9D2_ADIRI|nr:unnamed protein product [Adineta ricciae]